MSVDARVPRPASTVILLRDGVEGIETYLLRRATTMAFAPSMHVFPGGRVDEVDFDREVVLTESTWNAAAQRASCDIDLARALYACAIRETWEEARVPLVDIGQITWSVSNAELVLFDHWVTPERDSKRYDVRFFISVMPPGVEATLATTEAVHAAWIRPRDALERFEAGDLAMLPPTEAVLRYLASFGHANAVMEDAISRPVQPLLPRRTPQGSWELVHAYSGDVISAAINEPHTHEDTGERA